MALQFTDPINKPERIPLLTNKTTDGCGKESVTEGDYPMSLRFKSSFSAKLLYVEKKGNFLLFRHLDSRGTQR